MIMILLLVLCSALFIPINCNIQQQNSAYKIGLSASAQNETTTEFHTYLPTEAFNESIADDFTTVDGNLNSTTAATLIITESTTVNASITTISTEASVTTTSTSTTENSTAIIDSANEIEVQQIHTVRNFTPEDYFCACDLQINICDIECCCDIDCPGDFIKNFNCQSKILNQYDYEYHHGLPSCKIDSKWYCVNDKSYDIHEDASPLYFGDDHHISDGGSKWPKEIFLRFDDNNLHDNDSYRYNDIIYLMNVNLTEFYPFEIESSLTRTKCNIKQPLRFLNNMLVFCERTANESLAFVKTLTTFLTDNTVLAAKQKIGHTLNEQVLKSKVIQPMLSYCYKKIAMESCQDKISFEDHEKFNFHSTIMDFHSNFTHLIGLNVYYLYDNTTNNMNLPLHKTEVNFNFKFMNRSKPIIKKEISGNLGYYPQKPLIIGQHVPLNHSADGKNYKTIDIINYFHPNHTYYHQNILRIPKVMNDNFCVLNNITFDTINYGEHIFRQCKINMDTLKENLTVESNFTTLCENIQIKVLDMLFKQENRTMKTYVSRFGNPRRDPNSWVNIIYRPLVNEKKLIGMLTGTNEFTCNNILLSISYEFLVSRRKVGLIPNQYLVEAVTYAYGSYIDLTFTFDENIEIPIFIRTQFFDINSSLIILPHNLLIISAAVLIIINLIK